jgi:tetratricopeptide (TPR) repeat protein
LNWERRYKQPFNIAYFTVSTAAIATVCITKDVPILGIVAFGFALFALAAFRSAWSGRVHPNDFAVSLSKRTRATLRAAALLVPIPFMAILIAQPLAYEQMKEGGRLFSQEKNKEALAHLNLATFLNPQLQHAYSLLADCYNFTGEHDKSLANAEKALTLDPTDGGAWASKAWALNRQQKYSEALPAALNAVKYIPEGAQANHALADAYYALGEYELALPPATKHAQIHYREPGALFLQADILEKLNRPDEAAEARAAAAAINNQ